MPPAAERRAGTASSRCFDSWLAVVDEDLSTLLRDGEAAPAADEELPPSRSGEAGAIVLARASPAVGRRGGRATADDASAGLAVALAAAADGAAAAAAEAEGTEAAMVATGGNRASDAAAVKAAKGSSGGWRPRARLAPGFAVPPVELDDESSPLPAAPAAAAMEAITAKGPVLRAEDGRAASEAALRPATDRHQRIASHSSVWRALQKSRATDPGRSRHHPSFAPDSRRFRSTHLQASR